MRRVGLLSFLLACKGSETAKPEAETPPPETSKPVIADAAQPSPAIDTELAEVAEKAADEIHDAKVTIASKFAYVARAMCERAMPAIDQLKDRPDHAKLVKEIEQTCLVDMPAAAIKAVADEAEGEKKKLGREPASWCSSFQDELVKFRDTLAKRSLVDDTIKGHIKRWNVICAANRVE
jgi:hypothetical protein